MVTERVTEASARVSQASTSIDGAAVEVLATAEAAADTAAAAAFADAAARAFAVGGRYARSADALGNALSAAAQCYQAADRLPGPGG